MQTAVSPWVVFDQPKSKPYRMSTEKAQECERLLLTSSTNSSSEQRRDVEQIYGAQYEQISCVLQVIYFKNVSHPSCTTIEKIKKLCCWE